MFVTQTYLFKNAAYVPKTQAVPGQEQGGISVFRQSKFFHDGLGESQTYIEIRFCKPQRKSGAESVVEDGKQFLPAFIGPVSLVGGKEESACHAVYNRSQLFLDRRISFQKMQIVHKDS